MSSLTAPFGNRGRSTSAPGGLAPHIRMVALFGPSVRRSFVPGWRISNSKLVGARTGAREGAYCKQKPTAQGPPGEPGPYMGWTFLNRRFSLNQPCERRDASGAGSARPIPQSGGKSVRHVIRTDRACSDVCGGALDVRTIHRRDDRPEESRAGRNDRGVDLHRSETAEGL